MDFPLSEVRPYTGWVFSICVLLSSLPVVSIPLVALYRFTGFLKRRIMNRHNRNPYAEEEFSHGDL